MQAVSMRLEICILLSHCGVFDFKPIFSWSLYFIKCVSVHYIKALSAIPGRRKKIKAKKINKSCASKASTQSWLEESKPLIEIRVYTFINQTNKCYHKSCCSCQTKCFIAVILCRQRFSLSAEILHRFVLLRR